MNQSDVLKTEMEKVASLVGTARRLLATGRVIDLSALEGKVRRICGGAIHLGNGEGKSLRPGMEALLDDLDRLAQALRDRHEPAPEARPEQ
jgi:hypothetical protein